MATSIRNAKQLWSSERFRDGWRGSSQMAQPTATADALWSVEQILRAGSFGAVIFWQQHVRSEPLRRLILAAQSTETLFFLQRPVADAMNSSPATLRLAVHPLKTACRSRS
ncbi:hypothetical protein LJR034_003056 [Caballeronia sp. LjRoot34]|uniref:hypothetical protein n=1 Tax=Caballeronia sp. LjRoot34 TaxID=3342325 RepID=UPI003ED06C0C